MKRVYVLRHAKSSWDDANLTDFDRPLNPRGRETAPFMGSLMRDRGLLPQLVLSSPAKRALETAQMTCGALGLQSEIKIEDSIYEAGLHVLVSVLGSVEDNFQSVMIVGHNPGIEGLVRYLTGQLEAMPTASLAIIDLNIERWSKITQECGTLVEVLRPKEVGYLT